MTTKIVNIKLHGDTVILDELEYVIRIPSPTEVSGFAVTLPLPKNGEGLIVKSARENSGIFAGPNAEFVRINYSLEEGSEFDEDGLLDIFQYFQATSFEIGGIVAPI